MHPLNTARRRRLVTATVRLERAIRRDHFLPRLIARRRLLSLMRGHNQFDWLAL
jgi:hypothetical protein